MTTETYRTETHIFFIQPGYHGQPGFLASFRPLNPKTGEPWQAERHINNGADLEHRGYEGRPNAYTTIEKAREAVARQAAKLTKSRKAGA